MKYAILIYEAAEEFAKRNDPAHASSYWASWSAYTTAMQEAGIFVGGAGLHGPETSTTVRLRDDKRLVQDGPYAATKEQLGGFYLIDVPDLDNALEWAARCPACPTGAVEVRPQIPMNEN